MKKLHNIALAAIVLLVLSVVQKAKADISYDQTVTAIFGSGNPNDGWTTDTSGGLTIGLRIKERSPPGSTTNVNGVYTTALNTPEQIEFTINTGSALLNQYTYTLSGNGTSTTSFSFGPTGLDDAYGNSSTVNGGGLTAGTFATYDNSPSYDEFQNSEELSFGFVGGANFAVDQTEDFTLTVMDVDSDTIVAQDSITWVDGNGGAVSDATGTLGLLAGGIGALMLIGGSRKFLLM